MVREFGESPNLRKSLEEDWKIPSTKYWIRDSITVRRLLSASLEDYPLLRNFLLGLKMRGDWASVLGKVGKGIKCSVVGCGGDAIRSVSPDDISRAGLRVSTSGRGYL